MSKCVSCIAAKYHGPLSHLSACDTNLGLRAGSPVVEVSLGLPTEYCIRYCNPPKYVGEAKSMALGRRSWKRAARFGPPDPCAKPTWRSTGLVCTKLPLETPRKPTTSPAFLKGVSMKPSLRVPHTASRPRKLSRVASVPVSAAAEPPSSTGTVCSTCQIAFIPLPRDLLPLNPMYELPTSISFRFTRADVPAAAAESVETVVPTGLGLSPRMWAYSGQNLP